MATFEVYYGRSGRWTQVGLLGAKDLPAIVKSSSDTVRPTLVDIALSVTPRLSKIASDTLLPRITDASTGIVAGGASVNVASDIVRPVITETAIIRVFGPAYTDTIRPTITEAAAVVKSTAGGTGSGVYGSGTYGAGLYGSGSGSATSSVGFDDAGFEINDFDAGLITNTAGTPRLATSGNKIVRADNNNQVILRGANFMNHEHTGVLSNSNYAGLRNVWRGNIAMIGYSTRAVVNNLNHPYYPNTPYRTILDNIVAECKNNNMYVVFAPRWSGIEGRPVGGDNYQPGTNTWSQDQFVGVPPTEAEDSLAFLATRYMDDTNVMFAAQVESNGTSSTVPSWDTMKPYYQRCVDRVRSTGNSAIVMTSGIDYGKNISGAVTNPLTGTNIVYKAHVYNRPSVFQSWFGVVHDAGLPVFIGEFGIQASQGEPWAMDPADVESLMTFLRDRKISWCGWAFEAGQNPAMISDNGTVAPTSWAVPVKAEMMRTPSIPGDPDGTYTPPAVSDTGFSITRNKPTYATAGNSGVLVDGLWDADSWRVPYPNSFSVDISTAPLDKRGPVTFAWNGPQYNSDSVLMGGTQYNMIGNYTLYGNAAAGDQTPPASGWVNLGTFSNTRRGRMHTLDLTGYNWFRMTLNSGHPNNDQTWNKDGDISKIEIISGISPADSWMFHGDSITCAGAMVQNGVASKVEIISPERRPIFEMLGVPGTTAADYATGANRATWLGWLDASPAKNVTLNFGTNDAGAEVLDSTTLASRATAFDTAMRVLINDVTSRGKKAWIPKIPWSTNAQRRTNYSPFNTKIEGMYGTNVGRGPDFFTLFTNRTDLLADDVSHPNDAGYQFWANEWAKVIAAANVGEAAVISEMPRQGISTGYTILNRSLTDVRFELDRIVEAASGKRTFVRIDSATAASEQAKVDIVMAEIASRPTLVPLLILGSSAHKNSPPAASFWGDQATKWKGKCSYYEILNEPDMPGQGNWDPNTYADTVKAAYIAIKAVDSNAKVFTGGLFNGGETTGTIITAYTPDKYATALATRANGYFDALSMHLYENPRTRGRWNVWDRTFPSIEGVATDYSTTNSNWTGDVTVRSILNRNGLSHIPIISTENGIGQMAPAGSRAESEQVTVVTGDFDMVAAGIIKTHMVYTMMNDSVPGFGLLRDDRTKRPAFTTFQNRAIDSVVVSDTPASTSVDDSIIGTGVNQWQYSANWLTGTGATGVYNGGDHYTGTAGSTATLKFQGQRVQLTAAKAFSHGMFSVTIDGGTATTVDLYQNIRADDAIVYDSGIIANGIHTLVVTALGTKNASSSGTSITIDRAIINAPTSTALRSVDTVVYDHFGSPLRTDGLFAAYGKHELALPTNSSYDWTHGARPDKNFDTYPNSGYTHHNIWGQVMAAATGTPERRVRLQIIVDGVWHLVNGVWVQRRTTASIGNMEGAYWGLQTFSSNLSWVSGTHFRTEATGGHSFDLLPTTNSDGSPHTTQGIAHWFYSGFWPREPFATGTTAIAIQSRMRLISDVAGVNVDNAKFVGTFNGDLFTGAEVAVGSNGANPGFSITRHKTIGSQWRSYGVVTGTTEAKVRAYPTMPFLT